MSCLAEALTGGSLDLQLIGDSFIRWYSENYWTPHGKVFDIGITTREAISRLANGINPTTAGGFEENENGNGSLMRVLPLVFYQKDKNIEERYNLTKAVSSITHGHIRSIIACFYYLEFALSLLAKQDKWEAYGGLQRKLPEFFKGLGIHPPEIAIYDRLLNEDISAVRESSIKTSGYVLHTLEASRHNRICNRWPGRAAIWF
jgi:ADP-ribosyl-[dinitrogen reductase] hydrolase